MFKIVSTNAKRRCGVFTAANIAFFAIFVFIFTLLFICTSCKSAQNSEGLIAPPTLPNSQSQATGYPVIQNTQNPTETGAPTETAVPTSFPTTEPGMPDKLGLYIAENGERTFVDKFSSKWAEGQNIDCFEVLASDEESLSGKFGELWESTWNNFSNTKNVKIGYKLEIHLFSGETFSFDIKNPKDAMQYKEYIEVYLYDDIHVSGWYSHLEEDDMKDETIMTSIKLTATPKQNEINKIHLTAYFYTTDMPQRNIASYEIDVINDISEN
ncbi:MAG: hypothetical protein E7387_05785 [Ruminococcaceae bacterium]|nr:hypothetical protein [Oscillospiraceae bacterium]